MASAKPDIAAFTAKFMAERDAKIPAQWRLSPEEIATVRGTKTGVIPFVESKLTPKELEITNWSGAEALKHMHAAQGERTSIVDVTTAMCKRAALIHQLCNTLTVVLFDDAIKEAEAKEAAFVANGYKVPKQGPFEPILYGLPITVKESFDVTGTPTTWGFVQWAMDPPAQADSTPVIVLRGSGAIITGKTNVPMSLMAWESTNNVAGRCLNPHNVELSPGGSSGGEGAVVGSGASYLGAGTDIAGSIRLPSTVCGCYGLKPSSGRFILTGSRVMIAGAPGPAAVPPVQGPLGKSVEDLELYTRAFTQPGMLRFDASIIDLPYREVKLPAKLKLGYFSDNGACFPAPPVQAMMDDTVSKLRAAGHELVEFKPHDVFNMFKLAFRFFDAYYGHLMKVIGPKSETGDPWISAIEADLNKYIDMPENDPKFDMPMSVNWDNYIQREIAKHFWTQQFLDLGLDGIVCPTAGVPAPPHELSGKMTPVPISYTCAINLLDWTAGVIPARVVSKADCKPYTVEPRNEYEKACFEVYNGNLDKYENSRVGLQVVGLRLQEEKVLEMMKVIDNALKA